MTIVTFLLLLVIAAIAAGCWVLIVGWNSRSFAGAFVAFALLLVLPALLPKLLGG
jgi:endonuclease/exonuclease/phosphatase (EEP) superfamily protein YafD